MKKTKNRVDCEVTFANIPGTTRAEYRCKRGKKWSDFDGPITYPQIPQGSG